MVDKLVLLERPSGSGHLVPKEGGTTVKARYQLGVYQRMIDAGSGESLPGVRQIEGKISVPSHPLFTMMNVGKYYTLSLADGRKLDFFFRDQSGSIANSGLGLYSEAS